MTVFTVGDLHGSQGWIRIYNQFRQCPDRHKIFIFLGDLCDSADRDYHEDILDIKSLSNLHLIRDVITHDDRTFLCLGNHDVAKLLNEPVTITHVKDYKEWDKDPKFRTAIIRMQAAYRRMIKTGRTSLYKRIDGWIFSHAGISYLDHTLQSFERDLVDTSTSLIGKLKRYNTHDISPMYTRDVHLRAVPGYNQVVGHTPVKNYLDKNKFPAIFETDDGHKIYYIDCTHSTKNIMGLKINTKSGKVEVV